MESLPTRIGPYEIKREIGRGGMGIVYLARETDNCGRLVALKVLPKEYTSDPERLRRFQREAGALSGVRHANIVPVYGVGEADGVHFIAMRYIPGTSLEALIRDQAGTRLEPEETTAPDREGQEGSPDAAPGLHRTSTHRSHPLSEPQWVYRAVRIVEKVARALAHLHENGAIHRDVKPGNILIDQRGEPWLVDFGLVREVDADSVSDEEAILGTPQYLAPEQIVGEGAPIDHRSDLYALGVTLYEVVTLRRPFAGRGTSSTLYAIARETPAAPRKLNPNLSGDALADDLRRVRTFRPVQAARAPVLSELRRFCARSPMLAFSFLFAALCLVAMLELLVYRELCDRRRLLDCREEAELAFERGSYRAAEEGYRIYLRLGGNRAGVIEKLAFCREQQAEAPAPEPR
jgi:eukaryotic-like serine/threonine-protein kinase